MRASQRAAVAILAALATLAVIAPGLLTRSALAIEDGLPRIEVGAPAALAGAGRRLQDLDPGRIETLMTLVGLDRGAAGAGDPIQVVLAPEDHPLARGVPMSVAGYAVPERSLAVILPDRLPRYPYDSLEVVLLHEVTHVLSARAARGRPMPRWWSEGVAMLASRGWSLEDRSRVLLGAVSGVADTGALERSFDGGEQQVTAAYAISGALVHDLVQRHGPQLVGATLARIGDGDDFETAFATAAGVPLAQDVEGFWRRYLFWYRWLPFLTSGAALWASVTALAIVAGIRRRRRDAEIRRRWEAEERLAERARESSSEIVN
jgi:hypothetical protein